MKNKTFLTYLLLILLAASCRKQSTYNNSPTQPANFAGSAIQYLRDNLPAEQFNTLDIAAPNVIRFNGEEIAVRIAPRQPDAGKFILLRKASGTFSATWVDLSQLKTDTSRRHSGAVSLSDLDNRLISRYTVMNNLVIQVFNVTAPGSLPPFSSSRSSISSPDNPQELEAFIVTGRRSYGDFNYTSGYWLFGQDADYRDSYVPTWDYTGGSTPSSSETEVAPTYVEPDHPIDDIKQEMKCFTVDNNAVYSVTVNVNQPKPGTRSLINLSSPHKVGHTYLTMQEQLTDGSAIIRNVGFYPRNFAKPGNETDVSVYGEDSETPFCVALKISVSAKEFSTIQTALYNQQIMKYDLDDYNCTTSVIKTLESINLHLPATIGHTGVFNGNDPGDLGQDITELSLEQFSTANGGRKLVRTIKQDNSGKPPSKSGECK